MSRPPITPEQLRAVTPEEFAQRIAGDPDEAAQWIKAAAEQGMPDAQALLGQILLDGRGIESDAKQARHWFRQAAESGHLMGMNMLGRSYELGWGGSVDLASAAYWFRLAANQGLDWAMYNYANLLLHGNGVPKDEPLAFDWYKKAADMGHAKSLGVVGRFYEEGWLGEQDRDKAFDYYRQSSEAGDFRGQYNYSLMLAEAGRLQESLQWMREALKNAHLKFTREMAGHLARMPHPEFHLIALEAWEKCCREGDAGDYFAYGKALLEIKRSPADVILGKAWLQRAAQSGHPDASHELARYPEFS